jgi:hypothetical protein
VPTMFVPMQAQTRRARSRPTQSQKCVLQRAEPMRQTRQQHALGFELIDLRRSGMTRKPRQVEGAARVGMTLASAISRIRAMTKAFGAQSRPA